MSFNPNDPQYDGFKFPQPGAHILLVTKAEVTKSKAGNTMIDVTVKVVGDDPDSGAEVPWNYFVIKDNALWKLAEFCRALHPPVQSFNPKDQSEVNRELMGRHCVGVTVQREDSYKGETKTKTEVSEWRYPNDKIIEQLALLGDPSTPPAQGPATNAPVTDDDIPF